MQIEFGLNPAFILLLGAIFSLFILVMLVCIEMGGAPTPPIPSMKLQT